MPALWIVENIRILKPANIMNNLSIQCYWPNMPIFPRFTVLIVALFMGVCLSVRAEVSTKVLDRQPLTILPASGSWFPAADGAEIYFIAPDRKHLKQILIFENRAQIAAINGREKYFELTNMNPGTNVFFAKAVYDTGLMVTSPPVSYYFEPPGLRTALWCGRNYSEAPALIAYSPAIISAIVTTVTPASITNLTLNGMPQLVQTGEFNLTVPLTEGENTFVLEAKDNQGRIDRATNMVCLKSTLPQIQITSPNNNILLNAAFVNVGGSFNETMLKQIWVNGMPAFVSSNTFEAMSVSVAPGTNTITAVAEDLAGNIGTNAITVIGPNDPNAQRIHPVQLQVNPQAGFAPLSVTFAVKATVPGNLKQVIYDFDGRHVPDQITHDFSPVTHTYSAPCERFPIVTVETTIGRFSSAPGLRVNAEARPIVIQSLSVRNPVAVKATAQNNLYVLSGTTASLTEFNAQGKIIRSLEKIGSQPSGLDVDLDGNVYVAMSGNNQVWKYKPTMNSFAVDREFGSGGYIGSNNGSAGINSGLLNQPFDICLTPIVGGNELLVSDSGNQRVQQFSLSGEWKSTFGQRGTNVGQFNFPKGLSSDWMGVSYIVDSENNQIVVASDGVRLDASGGRGEALGQFNGANGICVGTHGICVADTGNNRVQIFDLALGGESRRSARIIPRVALSSELGLKQPTSVTWVKDPLDEKIYIADTGNNRVLLVKLPRDNPKSVWDAMNQCILAGDIAGASSYYASFEAEEIRHSFTESGTNSLIVATLLESKIVPVFIGRDLAQYTFDEEVSEGTPKGVVEFIRENGTWKILDNH